MESRESIDLDIKGYFSTVKRHWLPAASIFVATVALSALAIIYLKPSYQAEGKLLFKIRSFNVVGTNLLPSSLEGGEPGELKSLVSTQNPISTQVEIISSPPLLQRTIDKLQLKNKKGELLQVEDLAKALTLKIVGGTDVLKITYKSSNPTEAAAVVNTVMDFYLKNDILASRSEAQATRQLIVNQLPKNRAAVQETEAALRIFKQKNNIVNLSEETKSAVEIIGNLDNQINSVKAELDQANAQTNELRQKVALDSQAAISASALSQSPAVKATLTQLQDIERQLATERGRFQDESPIIINLEAKKANLTNLLQKEVVQTIGSQIQPQPGLLQIGELRQNLIANFMQSEIQRQGLAQKLASLNNSRTTYEQRLKVLPQLEQQQRDLERTLEVAQSTYQTLLKKAQELQAAENNNTSNARIIAEALVPQKSLLGLKPVVLLLGVMCGTFFATTMIAFLETRHRSLKKLKKVRDISPGSSKSEISEFR